MRVALAQINPVVGDLLGNADRILQAVDTVIGNEATLLPWPSRRPHSPFTPPGAQDV